MKLSPILCCVGPSCLSFNRIFNACRPNCWHYNVDATRRSSPLPSFLPSRLPVHQLVNRLINKFFFLLQVSNSTYMTAEPQSTAPHTSTINDDYSHNHQRRSHSSHRLFVEKLFRKSEWLELMLITGTRSTSRSQRYLYAIRSNRMTDESGAVGAIYTLRFEREGKYFNIFWFWIKEDLPSKTREKREKEKNIIYL